jgi:hypothetical protein
VAASVASPHAAGKVKRFGFGSGGVAIEEFLYVSRDPAFGQSAAGSLDNFLSAYSSNLRRLADPENRTEIVPDAAAAGIYVAPSLIIYQYIQVYLADEVGAVARPSTSLHVSAALDRFRLPES